MDEALFPVDENGAQTFAVELDVFSGPFSVLLSLIAKRRLDVTTVSLSEVTDEFIAYVRSQDSLDLSQVSEFLVVAATLLDLKLARLLPHDEETSEDFELLEQRDVLFAKLLQYRAYKEVAADFREVLNQQSMAIARKVPLEPMYLSLLPDVELHLAPEELAMLAVQAMTRDVDSPEVTLTHMHNPVVSVASQVEYILDRLVRGDRVSFASLCADAANYATVVSRFMAILDLIRNGRISIQQDEPLGVILITLSPDTPPSEEAHASMDFR